ncbi:MAG: arginase [Phototrophicales bacterium]|nr:MAG: arginase [Phototrophicales bacterium]
MNILSQLVSPEPNLFYKRNDPNDIRLGEVVTVDHRQYAEADIIIIGCPQDEGVRRNKGRLGAAQAPNAIRKAFYRLVAPQPLQLTILDVGNTPIQTTLEDTHTIHSEFIQKFIADNKQVISLGGGNDLAYADCMGLSKVVDSVLAINIDAHFDVRADATPNSGTPYRQLLEEGYISPSHFYEVGSVPMVNSAVYRDYLLAKQAHIIELTTLKEQGIQSIFSEILKDDAEAIFWGLDMDVVRAADAPGVSAPNPIGLYGDVFCQIGGIAAADQRSRIFEITEVNPYFDIDERTCRLAAATLYQFIATINQKRGL